MAITNFYFTSAIKNNLPTSIFYIFKPFFWLFYLESCPIYMIKISLVCENSPSSRPSSTAGSAPLPPFLRHRACFCCHGPEPVSICLCHRLSDSPMESLPDWLLKNRAYFWSKGQKTRVYALSLKPTTLPPWRPSSATSLALCNPHSMLQNKMLGQWIFTIFIKSWSNLTMSDSIDSILWWTCLISESKSKWL